MQNLLELNLGFVSCDICGEGQNGVGVWFDPAAADTGAPYRVIRRSACYGGIDQSGLTKDEVLTFLEDQHFLVATRYARGKYNEFIRAFKADKFTLTVEVKVASINDLIIPEDEGAGVPEEAAQCSEDCTVCYPPVQEAGAQEVPRANPYRVRFIPSGTMNVEAPTLSDMVTWMMAPGDYQIVGLDIA